MKLTIHIAAFKVGSHDPMFASNYSLAHFHPIRSKEPPMLNFSRLDLTKYFHKMAATAGSSCGEVGMKFLKQELLKFFEVVTK